MPINKIAHQPPIITKQPVLKFYNIIFAQHQKSPSFVKIPKQNEQIIEFKLIVYLATTTFDI